MNYQPPVPPPSSALTQGPNKLSDALDNTFKARMTIKRMNLKHGNEPIMGKPQPPKGMATHKGNIY